MNKKKKQHLINGEIRGTEVRVTDEGVMSVSDAQRLAQSKFLDLVMINDKANPPICKIMNYEKFIYEQGKKGKPKSLETKEIKFGPNTSDNDVEYRVKHITEFLQKGHPVKLSMRFKGREITHIDTGKELMLKVILAVEEFGMAESMPSMEGKKMFATIKPKSK
jgi:translation initiation factor IF-3